MDIYTATEQAYKNGYEDGYKAALLAVLDNYNKFELRVPYLVEFIAHQANIKI